MRVAKKEILKSFFSNIIPIPGSIYGRFLLLIVAPALIVQIVSISVFYYNHIDIISKHMARSVVVEMAFINRLIKANADIALIEDFSENIGLGFFTRDNYIEKVKNLNIHKIADTTKEESKLRKYVKLLPFVDPYQRFKSELDENLLAPYQIYKTRNNENVILVKFDRGSSSVYFFVPIKRITSSTTYVFVIWMLFTAFITSIISIIFLRNQVRSIKNLSKVAEEFGKGKEVGFFKVSGPDEIRSLGISFLKMKDRVKKQILQRTEMLSGVSHDLRTPLTRMKLQVEMLGDFEEVENLKNDILDMEKLINEYLDFITNDYKDDNEKIYIKQFVEKEIIKPFKRVNKNIFFNSNIDNELTIIAKKTSIKRAIINLIDNAFKYGNGIVEINIDQNKKNLIINIEDDGEGVPKKERNNILRPFYRIDNSRNLDKTGVIDKNSGGSGLGLAITSDIILSYGGRIKIGDSDLGGLCVTIYLPI